VTLAPETLIALTTALDGLADALASGDPDVVLSAELPLAAAASALPRRDEIPQSAASDLSLLRAAQDAGRALARCAALGRASSDLLALVAPAAAYGPAGRWSRPADRPSTVRSRS
jgi:hypothetical protein